MTYVPQSSHHTSIELYDQAPSLRMLKRLEAENVGFRMYTRITFDEPLIHRLVLGELASFLRFQLAGSRVSG